MQKFSEYEAMASDAVDDLYGEKVRLEPRADGRFVRSESPDPSRVPFNIPLAAVDFTPALIRTRNAGRNDADMPDISGELVHVSVRNSYLQYQPQNGDRLVLVDRPGQPTVAIVKDPEPDGIGRTILRCVATDMSEIIP